MITAFEFAKRMRPFCRRYLVRLRCVKVVPLEYQSPFCGDLGLIRLTRTILFTKEAPPGALIHELGHALFDPPFGQMSNEFKWFGWEWRFAQALDIEEEWRAQNHDYEVDTGPGAFGQLNREAQDTLLEECAIKSKKYWEFLPETNTSTSAAIFGIGAFSNHVE